MKVKIDREECINCGICWEVCPDVFEENADDGWSQIVKNYREGNDPGSGDFGKDKEDCAREAADGCPVEIIHITT